MAVVFKDNSAQTLRDLEILTRVALEAVGNQAVSHARNTITTAGRVDTGALRGNISHRVDGHKCYIGTDTGIQTRSARCRADLVFSCPVSGRTRD